MENEHKKVYILGVGDSEDIENIKFVSNFLRDCNPNNVVVELCEERFNSHYNEIMKHPKYEAIMEKFYQVLNDDEKITKLSEKSNLIELKEMEYLIGIDVCSYRLAQCRSVLGDRSYSITKKRMKAKTRLSDILGDEESQQNLLQIASVETSDSLPEEEIKQVDQVIEETSSQEEFDFSKIRDDVVAKEKKTYEQIYDEVVIDEVNQELLKNVSKCEGNVVNVIVKKERISSFGK